MNSLIEERNQRTRKRKKIKRDMDRIIGLSGGMMVSGETGDIMPSLKLSASTDIAKLADNRTIRLLDEGYFDNGFVIKKGTLEKYIEGRNEYVRGYEMGDDGWQQTDVLNLTNEFIGTVNLGHMDFATFPFIIGEWTKEDLRLVETENDRRGIDVKVKLDEDSIFVKELKRQPFEIGISSEFYYHVNEADTESLSEMLGYYMPVIDEVFIFAYGLVGECGNVNSSGLELKGDDMAIEKVDIELTLDNVEETIENLDLEETIIEGEEVEIETEENEAELGVEEIDITINEEAEAEEEDVELSADDVDEDADEAEAEEESDEEDEIEEVSEDADDEDEVEEADELTEALALINALKTENAGLKDIIAELKKSNRKNAKKLAAEKEAKAKFLEATKELSIELLPNEEEAEKLKAEEEARLEAEKQYKYGDGIAEI